MLVWMVQKWIIIQMISILPDDFIQKEQWAEVKV